MAAWWSKCPEKWKYFCHICSENSFKSTCSNFLGSTSQADATKATFLTRTCTSVVSNSSQVVLAMLHYSSLHLALLHVAQSPAAVCSDLVVTSFHSAQKLTHNTPMSVLMHVVKHTYISRHVATFRLSCDPVKNTARIHHFQSAISNQLQLSCGSYEWIFVTALKM